MADRNPGVGLYRLRVFGGLHLEGPGGAAVGVASRRRPLALLAVLAVQGDRGLSRDRAAALLWGDTDDKHALRSLSDALYTIRAELGPDAILGAATELTLNPAVVESDVAVFTAALRRGDHRAAAEAWGGPLLEGFHVSGAQAFEEWLDGERRRLSGEFGDALELLAAAARREGRFTAAVTVLRRLAALDPYNSRIAVELARTLAQAGDPGNGLQVLRDHVAVLRSALGAEPDPEVARMIEALQRGASRGPGAPIGAGAASGTLQPGDTGFRSVFESGSGDRWGSADADAEAARATAGVRVRAEASPGAGARSRLARAGAFVAAHPAWAAIALVVLGAAGWATARLLHPPSGPRIHSLAVLPLRNLTGDSTVGPLVNGLTEELTTRLGRVADLQVTSRTSAAVYGDSALSARQIAAALGVEGLVEGAVLRWGDQVRATVQTIDARTDRHLGAERIEASPSVLPGAMAEAVLGSLRVRSTAEEWARVGQQASPDPRVSALLAEGRAQEALALDSLSADAWARRSLQLVDSTWIFPMPPDHRPAMYLRAAAGAAARAIHLDSSSSVAHHAVAAVALAQNDYLGAERELRRALALNPSNARAHGELAGVLALLRRDDDALAELHTAHRLAPLSGRVLVDYYWNLVILRAWDEFEEAMREHLRRWPEDYGDVTGGFRFVAAMCEGRLREALAMDDSVLALAGADRNADPAIAILLARLGFRDSAVAIVRRTERNERSAKSYQRKFWMAWAYAAIGEMDAAVYAFRDAAALDETGLQSTVLTCLSDDLRKDPRWPELLGVLNLTP